MVTMSVQYLNRIEPKSHFKIHSVMWYWCREGGGAVSLMDVFTAALHKPRSYLHPVSSALVSSSLAVCRKLRCAWMKWTKIVFFPAGFRFASKRQQGSLYLALLLEAVRHSEMQLKWCPHPWVNEWMLGQFVFCSSLTWSWTSPRVVVG